MKQENLQNNRVDYAFGSKKVVVVESHNFVLPVWAEYCSNTKQEYRLVTIDYHMDTRPIFSQYAYKACNGDLVKADSYVVQKEIYDTYMKHQYDPRKIEEMTRLYVFHDEHILVGYNMGYISDFYCVCKDREDFSEYYKHYFVVGEDENLPNFIKEAQNEKYMLDIDLDFFNSEGDFTRTKELLSGLIRGTDIITIAREHYYFDYLNRSSAWTNDDDLSGVLNLIRENAQ